MRRRIDGAVVLMIVASVLVTLQVAIPDRVGIGGRLFILGVLGGVCNALTDANDRRITFGREPMGEKKTLASPDLLAIGGAIGIVLTWTLLPVVYLAALAPRLGYDGSWTSLGHDIGAAFTAPLPIGGVELPFGWLWTGAMTVAYTACVLKVLSTPAGRSYGIVLPLAFVVELALGSWVFHEPVARVELYLIVPCIITLTTILFVAGHRDSAVDGSSNTDGPLARSILPAFAGALFGVIAIDFATRSTLNEFEPTQRAMVSVAFRAWSFSVFAGWFAFWMIRRMTLRAKGATLTKVGGKGIGLAAATGWLFSVAYFLRIPAIGQTLALGPLAFSAASAIAYPVACALYGTDGSARSRTTRLRQTFQLTGPNRDYRYLVTYLVMAVVLTGWCIWKVRSAT